MKFAKLKYVVPLLAVAGAGVLWMRSGTTAPGALNIAQAPLFTRTTLPPLNMLVMGKDHKIYYEAYNDASDLDGDGALDVGYRGWQLKSGTVPDGESRYKIDYYGYFNSYVCYTWNDGAQRFDPQTKTTDKTCSKAWSGDFLNYLTTSRMDALRRVLYGGQRETDTADLTVLRGAFFPQDAHSWGKEYQSVARDGYDISRYAPLSAPGYGQYHLFAVTTTSDGMVPRFRVMQNSSFRVWNWLSIEGPVAGNKCFNAASERVDCIKSSSGWSLVDGVFNNLTMSVWKRTSGSGSPATQKDMTDMFDKNAVTANLCGSSKVTQISKGDGNPFAGAKAGCGNDDFLTRVEGTMTLADAGSYTFSISGDDAVDLWIDGTMVRSWYGGHGADTSDTGLDSRKVTLNLSAGNHTVVFRHQEAGGNDSFGMYWYHTVGAATRNEYFVRVQVCPKANRDVWDDTCKPYPGGPVKPTGILHDYGESQRMYFGLITGSQFNNLEGGVLRRNIANFADEIDQQTGIFKANVNGIVHNLNGLRMIGGGYAGGTLDNTDNDSNWGWANGYGNCPAPNDSRALANGECRMWGNPVAEMLYESMRYFAGAATPTTRFSSGGASQGVSEETKMNLTTETWKDPYKPVAEGGLGYATCSRPYQTIISDINPSYDGQIPGGAWGGGGSNDVTKLAGFNAATEGAAIWASEFGGPRDVFIGQSGATDDGAPTVKRASSFGDIRGLAPEEPTKQGTYYSASVARFGRNNDINAAANDQNLVTYSIALASPLPRIEFPINGRTVTLIPFAKTVSGTFGAGTRKPVNTIVDFYVEQFNMAAPDNGGRPKAVFRINYEDVEQGNDHDMDAIVRYTIQATADGKLQVDLSSEYAAGSANQNIGYIISGTTKDGVYLEVRDRDGPGTAYMLNTPEGAWAGDCATNITTSPCNQTLPLQHTRIFSPNTSDTATGVQLKDPLWYAAKYGAPTLGSVNANGDPSNYFLVTNPLNLRAQLSKAFDSIQQDGGKSGSLAVSGARVTSSSVVVLPTYRSDKDAKDWTGDLEGYSVNADGTLAATPSWTAAANLPTTSAGVGARKIWTAIANVDVDNRGNVVRQFKAGQLMNNPTTNDDAADDTEVFGRLGATTHAADYGLDIKSAALVNYLRGERGLEGTVKNLRPFRERSGIMGDIINSAPVIATKRANYGWSAAQGLPETIRTAYTAYVNAKADRGEYVYVGANDGMLHAFDMTGREQFAYVPNGVMGNLWRLADQQYQHQFYVDGKLTLADAPIGGNWQTVLVGGTGAGGRSIFALNVTNPSNFAAGNVLWEVNATTDADMGYTFGKPVVVPMENGKWMALFGNGYNSASGRAALFAVDIATGKVLGKVTVSDEGIPDDDTTGLGYNGLGNIVALDSNHNGLVDTVYGGDLHGNVWKFDVSDSSEANWDTAFKTSDDRDQPLFVARDAAGVRKPITGGFEIAVGPGSGYMLYFGTGRYFVQGDNDTKDVNTVYGIWDNGEAITGLRDDALVQQEILANIATAPETRTLSRNPVSYYLKRGWYLDLVVVDSQTNAQIKQGERFLATPTLQNGRVYFPTYVPGQSSDCTPGGANWLYALSAANGGAALGTVTVPPNGDPVGGAGTGAVSTGDGAPSQGVGTTRPVPTQPVYCDPADPACVPPPGPPPTQCSEVIVDPTDPTKTLSMLRACGRQSWRQLR